MDFEALAGLGWREGLIAIIALLAVYVVVAFLRIRRLKRDASAPLADRLAAHFDLELRPRSGRTTEPGKHP